MCISVKVRGRSHSQAGPALFLISPYRALLPSLRTSFVSKDLTDVHPNPSGPEGLVNKQSKVKDGNPWGREAKWLIASTHQAAEPRLSERLFEMAADGFGMLAGHDFRHQRAGARLRKRSNHPFHARQARHAHAETVAAHAEQGERRHRIAGHFAAHAQRQHNRVDVRSRLGETTDA